MNDKVQNKIVEQKDIVAIIEILNNFYKEKNDIFNKTQLAIDEEQEEYERWNKEKYNSNNFANYPKFEYKTHYNKLTYEKFNFSFYCRDGITYEDKEYAEAQNIMATGFTEFEKISLYLDVSWKKTFKQDDYSYSDKETANVSVNITFYEEDVYLNYSSKNADGDINFLKSEISDIFDNLKPKYTKLISNRESIKYKSTLWISYIISAILVICGSYVFSIQYESIWWPVIIFVVLSLVVNVFVPSTKINKLYKQIIPPKKTVYEGSELKKVDNIKEYQRTSEVQIGKNSTKAGKREQIIKLQSKATAYNFFACVFCVIIIVIVCMSLKYF